MPDQFWLVKTEPYKYSWSQLVKDGKTVWDGVRNFEARNYLRSMKVGDEVLIYHSNEGKEVVGIAKVRRSGFQDPTTEEEWTAVEIEPVSPLPKAVTLERIREIPELSDMALLRRSRLSVTPVRGPEFATILREAGAKRGAQSVSSSGGDKAVGGAKPSAKKAAPRAKKSG
jgi:predicted RNA-binding protein with PUA-like domain